jgi:DNA-binding protein H-NS
MPRKKLDPQDPSIEEMEARLAQIEAARAMLEAVLKQRRAVELLEFAQSIREQMAAHGYPADDVIALLKKRRTSVAGRSSDRRCARYVDPDNLDNSYSRGPLPGWLRKKMEAAGYDANDKAHREEFKSTYLERVA